MLLNHEHWFYTRTNFSYVQKQKLKYRNNNSNHQFSNEIKNRFNEIESIETTSRLYKYHCHRITVFKQLYVKRKEKFARDENFALSPHPLPPPFIQHLPTIFSLMLSIIIILTRTKYAKYVLLYFIERAKSPLIIERLTHTV